MVTSYLETCVWNVPNLVKISWQWMEPSPLQKRFLFLGSFISSLYLLLVLSNGLKIYYPNLHKNNVCAIKFHKLKFCARLLIRQDFDYDLPLCTICKCSQFILNSIWDSAVNKTYDCLCLTILCWYLLINLSKQSFECNYDCKTPLRSFSMKNYMCVTIFMMIGQAVSKSNKDQQTESQIYQHQLIACFVKCYIIYCINGFKNFLLLAMVYRPTLKGQTKK